MQNTTSFAANIRPGFVAIALLSLIAAASATAGSKRYELSATYKEECGSCHIAYPPALLDDASWRAVLGGLDRHFGDVATLAPARQKALGDWLATQASRRPTRDEQGRPALRITATDWFRKEHRDGHDGLTAAIWRSPAVASASRCQACHREAERGAYDEGQIRLPS